MDPENLNAGLDSLTIVHQPRPEYLVEIRNDQDEPIVIIRPNGDVEIRGDVNEAARTFWNAVAQFADTSLVVKLKL